MSFVTAIITATIFAAFGFPYRHYQCWYSWGGIRSHVAGLVYFLLAGGGGGLLGWLMASLTHARPTGDRALDGFLYGAWGALALRADFRPKVSTGTQAYDIADGRHASSVLAASLQWAGTALDEISRRSINAWLKSLSDDDLVGEAYHVYALIKQDADTPARTKNQLAELLVGAMEQVRSPDPDERAEGRAHLVAFHTAYFLREHLPRPMPISGDRAAT